MVVWFVVVLLLVYENVSSLISTASSIRQLLSMDGTKWLTVSNANPTKENEKKQFEALCAFHHSSN